MEDTLHRALILSALVCFALRAETGQDAWLRSVPHIQTLPGVVATPGDSVVLQSAATELARPAESIDHRR